MGEVQAGCAKATSLLQEIGTQSRGTAETAEIQALVNKFPEAVVTIKQHLVGEVTCLKAQVANTVARAALRRVHEVYMVAEKCLEGQSGLGSKGSK